MQSISSDQVDFVIVNSLKNRIINQIHSNEQTCGALEVISIVNNKFPFPSTFLLQVGLLVRGLRRRNGVVRVDLRWVRRTNTRSRSRRSLRVVLLLAKHPLETGSLVCAAAVLLLLQICQAPGLGVNLLHLLLAILVELDELLARRGVGSLLKVRGNTAEEGISPQGEAVGLVGGLGTVGSMVLLVKAVDGGQEAAGHAMGLVELDGALDSGVADDVALGEVLGEDASTRLLLLRDLVGVALGVLGEMRGIIDVTTAGACHSDVVGTELGVVQEEGGLGSGLLLKSDIDGLGLALFGDLDIGNLATKVVISLVP